MDLARIGQGAAAGGVAAVGWLRAALPDGRRERFLLALAVALVVAVLLGFGMRAVSAEPVPVGPGADTVAGIVELVRAADGIEEELAAEVTAVELRPNGWFLVVTNFAGEDTRPAELCRQLRDAGAAAGRPLFVVDNRRSLLSGC